MEVYILCWLIGINLIAFIEMVQDKRRAEAGMRRTPEFRLLLLAFLGGALGVVTAARFARHKTRKQPFATWMLIWLWLDIILVGLWASGVLDRLILPVAQRWGGGVQGWIAPGNPSPVRGTGRPSNLA